MIIYVYVLQYCSKRAMSVSIWLAGLERMSFCLVDIRNKYCSSLRLFVVGDIPNFMLCQIYCLVKLHSFDQILLDRRLFFVCCYLQRYEVHRKCWNQKGGTMMATISMKFVQPYFHSGTISLKSTRLDSTRRTWNRNTSVDHIFSATWEWF